MEFPHNNIARPVITIAVLILVIGHMLWFTATVSEPYLLGDTWGWVRLVLQPVYEGQADWRILWNTPHPSPFRQLLFTLNAKYLGLSMDFERMVGILFKGLAGLVLLGYAYRKGVARSNFALFLSMIVVFYNFADDFVYTQYTWSVIATGHIHFFLIIALFILYDRFLTAEMVPNWTAYLIMALAVAFTLIAAKDHATVAIGALVAVVMVLFGVTRQKKYAFSIAAMAFGYALGMSFYSFVLESAGGRAFGAGELVSNLLENLPELFGTLAMSIASGLFPIELWKKFAGIEIATISSYLIFGLVIFGLIFYLRRKMWCDSIMPLFLVSFCFVFFVPVVVYRYLPGLYVDWYQVPLRYYHYYSLGIVGALWIYGKALPETTHKGIFGGLAVLLLVCGVEIGNVGRNWEMRERVNDRRERISLKIYQQAVGDMPRRDLGLFMPTLRNRAQLEFLMKHRLSLFNPNLMPAHVREYAGKAGASFDVTE